MEINILKKLGLSDKDVTIYLKLLACGSVSVRDLAQLTKLNRGTTYDILKKLQEIGLVSYFHQDTKQKFAAEDPEKILKLLKLRERELKETEEKLNDLIPELKSLQEAPGAKPVTKFYEGKNGIKFILEDLLSQMKVQKEKTYYVYSAAQVREDVYGAYPDFSKKRIKNKIIAKTISLSPGGGTYGLDERKWIPSTNSGQEKAEKEQIKNMTYIIIYADRCAFIARDTTNKPVGVIIENKMIYETQKTIFLQLWNFLDTN